MKTRQFVFALCFLFLLNSPAQCVDIIIGTGTSSQVYPFAASYHDARSQIIYPANEIGASYKIKAISFDVTTAPCQNTTQYLHDFTIRMKHTPLNYYTSAVWESEDWTTVYNNSDCSIIGTGWKTFTLNIPFDYRRDQGNLMVDICFNNSSSLNNGQCRYTSKSTCRSIQYGSNSTDGDPLMWSGSTPSALIYGYMPNIKLTADLIPQLPTPTFSPNGGAYNTDKSAIVSCTEPDCVIHYTTNGEIPTEDDPVIASGSSIAIDRTMILKAKAWKAGYEPSSVKSANFDMVVEKLTFTPDSGTYQTEQNVTISCSTPGAEIHYTTSGVDPTEADATIVSGSTITVPVNPGITLKAIACRSGWYPSAVKSATYRLPLLFYVSTSGDDNNDGLSWLSAKKTIQSTINLALAGDDIWISKGEYTEKLSVNVPIGVYGGFAGTESLLTERPAFPRTALDLNETVINTSGSSGTAVSVNTGGSQRLTKIDGFTIKASGGSNYSGIECKYSIVEISNNIIRGNSSKGISLNYGSSVVTKNVISNNTSHGVYCSGNETITDNIIQDNGSYGVCSSDTVTIMRNVIAGNGSAGIAIIPSQPGSNPGTISGNMISGNNTGIYLQNGQIKISNNIISGNISTSGGGGIICNSPVLPVIVNNRIIGNKASNGDGGGISYHGSSFGIIANNVIAQNSCTLTGGGLFIHYSSPSVFSNTIVGNVANTQGGAISLSTYSNSTITIANNIFAFNSSGVYRSYGNAIVKNNCAFENAAYNYSNFTTDPTGTDGNFIADPKLASIANSNFHIQPAPDSPCVDTGDDTLAYGTSDIDGQARIINSGIDIGADESDGTFWSDELQQIIRVSTDGDDANDGSAWNLAKKTIQNAILAAGTTGGEVWVKAGLYTECISMCPDVYLYGGFNGTESSRDQRDWYLNETIINGGNMGNVVSIAGGGDGFGIDGFTIQNPVSSSFCINCSNASATISNNSIISSGDSIHITNSASVITDNTIVGQVYCKSSSPQISNNMISGGTKGIYCSGCLSGTISSNNITGNIGSGIECQGSLLTISNNFIHGNTSKNGAGIYCSGTDSPLIINNIITGNNATFTGGGGIYCYGSAAATIINNTIVGNSAPDGGGIYCNQSTVLVNNIVAFCSSGIALNITGTTDTRNNCVYGNSDYNYSGFTIDPTGSNGNISTDPGIASVAFGNLHILPAPDSPCVDAGDDTVVHPEWLDMDGSNRLVGEHVDIGADESNGTGWTVTPNVFRVGNDGDDDNDGSSWETPMRSIKAAVDKATVSGGEVWVKAGTYYENIVTRPYTYLYGGFTGTEKDKSERTDSIEATIIDGSDLDTVITDHSGHRLSCVDGFTIQHGHSDYGGGIYSYGSSVITNNVVRNNSGSGVYALVGSGQISGNTIEDNIAEDGPGINVYGGAGIIENNIIRRNSSSQWTGAIYGYEFKGKITGNLIEDNVCSGITCEESNATISRNRVFRNQQEQGGGIYIYSCLSAVIEGNLVVGNRSSDMGAGIFVDWCKSLKMTNNTIADNTGYAASGLYLVDGAGDVKNNIIAFNQDGGISAYKFNSPGPVTITNNCFWHNSGGDIQGNTVTESDIIADPLFADRTNGDYHILVGSPCRDTGIPDETQLLDIDDETRPWGQALDIGVDEFVDSDGDGGADVLDASPTTADPDNDGDGVSDIFDNCPSISNPDQRDSDGDCIGDSCDPPITTVVYVDADAAPGGDGSSWTTAYQTVQQGIDAADAGDAQVWIAEGLYNENIIIWPGVSLYGGFTGGEFELSQRDYDSHETIIDGAQKDTVVRCSNEGQLDGFTIRNGKSFLGGGGIFLPAGTFSVENNRIINNIATGIGRSKGGGICAVSWSGKIINNYICGNSTQDHSQYSGGGIALDHCNGTIENNVVADNISNNAGGIYSYYGEPAIRFNKIEGNEYSGILVEGFVSKPVIDSNLIYNNRAYSGGGISITWESTPFIYNNVIFNNRAIDNGGGIFMNTPYSGVVAFNTIVGNTAPNGSAIYCRASKEIYSCIIANNNGLAVYNPYSSNPIKVYYCDLWNNTGGDFSSGISSYGILKADPCFIDPSVNDYHLQSTSPCINAGSSLSADMPIYDFGGQERPVFGISDIGAFEYNTSSTVAAAAKTQSDGGWAAVDGAVTFVSSSYFYVENIERTSGIRVDKANHGLTVGAKIEVAGPVKTNTNNERYIEARYVTSVGSADIQPLLMTNKAVGGGAYGYQEGVWGWVLVKDAEGKLRRVWGQARGLNTIGLLVKTSGQFKYVDASTFTINDGEGPVKCIVPTGITLDQNWEYISVIGVISCEKVGNETRSVLKVRDQADITYWKFVVGP